MSEIRTAIEQLNTWVSANPHYREQTYPIFEMLSRRAEGAKEADQEAVAMGLTMAESDQRERLSQFRLAVRAEDPPKIFHSALIEARQALDQWQAVHPEDPLISTLKEHLEMEAQLAIDLHSWSR